MKVADIVALPAALLGRAGKPCISIESQANSHRNGAGVRRAVVSEHHKYASRSIACLSD